MKRWMALDVGSKVIGIAVSDPLKMTARPLKTLKRTDLQKDLAEVLRLAESNDVSRIILGRPIYLSGEESKTLSFIDPLMEALREQWIGEVDWADERLSSKEAEQLMGELGIKPSERRKRRDEFAAALILQWYLEEVPHDR
ncbi:MAG TPA: Holliday junction resolvase RuvX [Acidobacteriota bacterium]|nr:Holliday junction resolvase RuvX [Acidobacteriota bacterium]